ncbi:MAG: hypothetical protein NZ922_06405 [Candidatus Methanomethyliaceae archaeon]|nr:hypothetical protein [Candidatus Methanomethyliaceae archaeon]MDW7971441.1 hypothetical protein [Nitrososphaerota archaeon]
MSQTMPKKTLSEKDLLDYAVRIGVQAKLDGIKKSQLENILASLELFEDPKHSLLVTAVYSNRQASRLKRGFRTADIISDILNELYRNGYGREEARKILGLAKWTFESIENKEVKVNVDIKKLTSEEFLKILRGG